jgi:D-alanyl-D-alanine carboxypeptidase
MALLTSGLVWAQPLVSPQFTLTQQSFASLVEGVPEPYKATILANPAGFLKDYLPLLSAPADQLVLVDKKVELASDYEPKDLVLLKNYSLPLNRSDLRFRKAYVLQLQNLSKAAKRAGLNLVFSSAYRSWIYQRDLFQSYVNKDGVATADRYSARAGHSQHQLGTVIDFGSITPEFADKPEGKWMATHAGEFGLSMSYPDGLEAVTGYNFEPWHFRYIGVEACAVQKKWFGDVQQYLLEFHARSGEALKAAVVPVAVKKK